MRVYEASTRISAEFGGIRDLSRHLSLNFVSGEKTTPRPREEGRGAAHFPSLSLHGTHFVDFTARLHGKIVDAKWTVK